MALNLGFDFNAEALNQDFEHDDPNGFFPVDGEEDDDEQMNFVMDLYESREIPASNDSIWNVDAERTEDSGLELGFGPGLRSAEAAPSVGLRVVCIDSESDSEEFEVSSSFINDGDDNNDSFGVNNYFISENEREEFEWEEVSEGIHFDGRENLNALIEGIEEISVSLDTASSVGEILQLGDLEGEGEGEEPTVESEVLLAMNNIESNFEFEIPEEENVDENEVPGFDIPDDYILTLEHDTLFTQLVEYENALRGSPPTAKSLVKNLPSVVLTKEEMGEDYSVVCAVCSDEVAMGEKVTRMPCCHIYHGDCILPWLKIRNTCPVCRYELPTDDADYEKRRE